MKKVAFPGLHDVLRLLQPAQVRQLGACPDLRFPGPRLAEEALRRGWLTPYQVRKLLRGRGRRLVQGPYVILDRLGGGATGKVYKVRHSRLNRLAALKVIGKGRLTDSRAAERFYREIRALAQLAHPNIVHAYDAGPVGDSHFLVMEYIEGTDLARLLQERGPLPVGEACDYVLQAALGLQHAHERGLVHRDLKPSNLLVEKGGRIKVVDFGLARFQEDPVTDPLTQQGVVLGTVDYMAPEQILDAHAVDARADLYSLGCTLYHLLTGRPPFSKGTVLEKLLKHQAEEPTPVEVLRPDVPAAVAAVVRRLMAKHPEGRFRTAAETAAALGAPLGPAPLPESLPSSLFAFPRLERPARQARRGGPGVAGWLRRLLTGLLARGIGLVTSPSALAAPAILRGTD